MIGIIWVNHHAVLHNVARVDRTEMFDSLLLLILVTAIPFSTAILARYLHRGSRDAHPAAAIDGLPVLGVALSFTALCAWAARRGLLHAGVPGRGAASSVRLSPPVAIAAAIGVAFLSALAAVAAHAVIAAHFCVARSPRDADPSAASPSPG